MNDAAAANQDAWDDPKTVASVGSGPTPNGEERIHCLVAVEGADPGCHIELTDQPLTIGRSLRAEARFADPELSSRHCTVNLVLDQVLVADLQSTNGTFIDGRRVDGTALLPPESLLQAGNQVLKHLYRSRGEFEQVHELEADLAHAAAYVRSLLPRPLHVGPVHTDYLYRPCAQLGGDAFGFHPVADDAFALYLLDVSGHGAGSALHAVSVMNVLNKQSLPDTEFTCPDQVLSALNRVFQMADHAEMYFTIWYGVYSPARRKLVYASGGHPPAVLVSGDRRQPTSLSSENPGIGLFPHPAYSVRSCTPPPDSTLYLFSDGAYEILLPSGEEWTQEGLREVVTASPTPPLPEPERIFREVLQVAAGHDLGDDCSIIAARFP